MIMNNITVGFKKELHQRLWIQLANPYVYTDKTISAMLGRFQLAEQKGKLLKKIFHRQLMKYDTYYQTEFRKIDPDHILYFWRDIACCYGCLAARYERCACCPVEATCKSDYCHWCDILELQEADQPFPSKVATRLAYLAYKIAFAEVKKGYTHTNGRVYDFSNLGKKLAESDIVRSFRGNADHPA